MRVTLLLREISLSLSQFKIRSLLTLIGVAIGISAVYLTINITHQIQTTLAEELAPIRKMIIITPAPKKINGVRRMTQFASSLREADVKELKTIPSVAHVVPIITRKAQVHSINDNMPSSIVGTTPEYLAIKDLRIAAGVSFNHADILKQKKVVIVGNTLQKKLFNDRSPLGATLTINAQAYHIIGVLQSQGQSVDGVDRDNIIIAPVSTIRANFFNNYSDRDAVDYILAAATQEELLQQTIQQLQQRLLQQKAAKHSLPADFIIRDRTKEVQSFEYIFTSIGNSLLIIGVISLVISGVGMSTLMFMSISERSREIALRKAIGATNGEILLQILLEAVLLSLIGGLVGAALGIGGTFIFNQFFPLDYFSMLTFLFPCILAAVGLGVISGFIPAYKTLSIPPINAMH